MINWCEKNQSKVILGGTLTSGADGKSSTHALGKIHDEVRRDLRDSDIAQLVATIRRDLLHPMCALAGFVSADAAGLRRCPHFVLDAQETEDITTWADALPKLAACGFQIPVQWAQEKLGIPQPQAGEAVLVATPAAVSAAPAFAALNAQLVPANAQTAQPSPKPAFEVSGVLGQQLAHNVRPHGAAWIETIRAAVHRANSLEELRDALDAALPDLSLDEWAAAMGEALVAAQLAGRWEVLSEAAAAGHRITPDALEGEA